MALDPDLTMVPSLRLTLVADRLSVGGGADVHFLQMVEAAAAAGAHVTVAIGRCDPNVPLPDVDEVLTVPGLASAVASDRGLDRLADVADRADVIHLQNVMNPVAIGQLVSTGRAVATIQDHRVLCPAIGKTLPDGTRCRQPMDTAPCATCVPDDDYRRRIETVTHARRDALRGVRTVALSRWMAEEAGAVGLGPTEVIPPWILSGAIRSCPGTSVLLGGRLVAHKAPSDGVQAWRRAGRPLPLRIAGRGPLVDDLQGGTHLGWLDRGQLVEELRQSRMLLFPARWQEPFGILAVEALSQGTPVIAADVGGTREWSDAGCLRVPPGDIAAMAAAITELTAHPQRALELGEAGRRAVATRFARSVIEPLLWRLWDEVAGGGSAVNG